MFTENVKKICLGRKSQSKQFDTRKKGVPKRDCGNHVLYYIKQARYQRDESKRFFTIYALYMVQGGKLIGWTSQLEAYSN